MRSRGAIRLVILLLCSVFWSCSGGGGTTSTPTAPVPEVVSNEFVLQPTLRVLPADTPVADMQEGRLVLDGQVDVQPGQTLIKRDGTERFGVKVVSVSFEGGQTVIVTEPITLADVFLSADIQRTDVLPAETLLENMEIVTPGVTAELQPAAREQQRVDSVGAIRLNINQVLVEGRDGLSATANGVVTLALGIESDIQQRPFNPLPDRVLMAPFITLDGDVVITGKATGKFHHEVPLFTLPPTRIPGADLGVLYLEVQPTVLMVLDGDVDLDGKIRCQANLTVKAGVDYNQGNFSLVGPPPPTFTLDADTRGNSRVRVSLLATDIRVNVQPGIGDFWLKGELLSAEANCAFRADVGSFGTQISTSAVGRLSAGGRALWKNFTAFDQELYRFSLGEKFSPSPFDLDQVIVFMGDGGIWPLRDGDQFTTFKGFTTRRGEATALRANGFVSGSGFVNGSDGVADLTRECIWTSDDNSIATVGVDGVVVGRGVGRTQIRVRHPSTDVGDVVEVRVEQASLRGLEIDTTNLDGITPRVAGDEFLDVSRSRLLDVFGVFTDAARPILGPLEVEWTTDPPGLALIAPNGLLTGVLPGSVRITASNIHTGQNATFSVTVRPEPIQQFSLQPTFRSITRGQSFRVTARGTVATGMESDNVNARLRWTSTTPSIVSVTADGQVTGVGEGLGIIEVTNPEQPLSTSNPRRVVVVVGRPPVSLLNIVPPTNKLGQTTPVAPLFVGDAGRIGHRVQLTDGSVRELGNEVRWTSSNPRVITVDAAGNFRAVGPGRVTLSARVDRTGANLEFRVIGPPRGLFFEDRPLSVATTSDIAADTIRVVIVDALQQRVPDATGQINLSLLPSGSATLTGNRVMTATKGVADFTGLFVSAPGTFRLLARMNSFAQRSLPFTAIDEGRPTIVFQDQPATHMLGSRFRLQIRLENGAGEAFPNAENIPVTIRLGQSPPGATLSGVLTRDPGASGTEVFIGLTVDRVGTYTIIVSAAGVEVESAPFEAQASPTVFVANFGPPTSVDMLRANSGLTEELSFAIPSRPEDLVRLGSKLFIPLGGNTANSDKVAVVDSAVLGGGVSLLDLNPGPTLPFNRYRIAAGDDVLFVTDFANNTVNLLENHSRFGLRYLRPDTGQATATPSPLPLLGFAPTDIVYVRAASGDIDHLLITCNDSADPRIEILRYNRVTRVLSTFGVAPIPPSGARAPISLALVRDGSTGIHHVYASSDSNEVLHLTFDESLGDMVFVEGIPTLGTPTPAINGAGNSIHPFNGKLYVLQQPNFVQVFTIESDFTLTNFISVATFEVNPKSLAQVTLPDGSVEFYVTTSNHVTGYFVSDDGDLNLMNTQFTGAINPGPIVP